MLMDRKKIIDHLQIIHIWAAVGKDPIYNGIEPKCCEDIEKWTKDALDLLKEQDELLKHEYWRGYNNGRADERGLQEGTIMQTFSPD